MEHMWEVPEPGFKKINVHCVVSCEPLTNGNLNGVGVVVRDEWGPLIWGGLGLMNSLSEEQAIMAGIQAACVQDQVRKWEMTHIETVHRDVYETIKLQEHILVPENQLEAFRLFNSIHANHFIDGKTEHSISCVPPHMKSVAAYMDEYGMNNLSAFSEVFEPFAELQFYLDKDIGMTIAFSLLEMRTNLGNGEVVDAAPPLTGMEDPNLAFSSVALWADDAARKWPASSISPEMAPFGSLPNMRGKSKLYEEYAFFVNVTFSRKALDIIQSGALDEFASTFAEEVVNLESPVGNGLFAKDILHHAFLGTLNIVALLLHQNSDIQSLSQFTKENEFMSVDQVLSCRGFFNEDGFVVTKKARRATRI